MRTSATAGLTPQQLLDRRRAQNKLAQRRFREKARMARTVGLPSSLAFVAAAPHLDLAAPYHHRSVQPRVRSDSSDSSGASSSSSLSASSQVSSPTSSCTELNTPTMPTFGAISQPDGADPVFITQDTKPEPVMTEARYDFQPPPALLAHSFVALDGNYFQPTPAICAPAPVTYSSLASSSSKSGLKVVGLQSDPFLMSQPLPSPSLLIMPSGMSSMLYGSTPLSHATYAAEVAADDVRLSLFTDVSEPLVESKSSQLASSLLEKTIDEPSQPRMLAPLSVPSQPYSRVVELLGLRFGLTQDGQGLNELLSRLQLDGQVADSAENCKGLVFEAEVDWDQMGSNMLPTTEQLLYPHRAFVDVCLPWPSVRSRLLKQTLTNPQCEQELALDLLLSVLSSDDALESFRVYGHDVLDPEAWELSQPFFAKWWGLFDPAILRRTNWWRHQRGLPPLSFPRPSKSANQYERQGLGTGSLDQVHTQASTILLA